MSTRPEKHLESLLEKSGIGFQRRRSRNLDLSFMKALETVQQHGTVDLLENVAPQDYPQIRSNPKNVGVECRVMKGAQGDSIGDNRLAHWMAVGEYVGRLWQFMMF